MNNIIKLVKILSFAFIILFSACQEEEDNPAQKKTGVLRIGLNVDTEVVEINARTNRQKEVDTNNFTVIIYDLQDNEVFKYSKFTDIPSEIELTVGQYYAVAYSNNFVNAGFEAPYYYGRTANFDIAKDEATSVPIHCQLGNIKITVQYSENVQENFTSYKTEFTANDIALTLEHGDNRALYFAVGPTLKVKTTLTYDGSKTKVLDDEIKLTTAKVHYKVFIDATLINGSIKPISIIVDESLDEEGKLIYDPVAFDNLYDGIVASYRFLKPASGSSVPETVNGYNGILTGGSYTLDRTGVANSAIYFDGIDDYISINDFQFNHETMTVSLWVKPDVEDRLIAQEIFTNATNPSDVEVLIRLEADEKYDIEWTIGNVFYDLSTEDDSGSNDEIGLISPTYNKFDHLVATYDGSKIRFYVNGELIKEKQASGLIYDNDLPMIIGRGSDPNAGHLKGVIDDVMIFDRALRDAEVFYLYTKYSANHYSK